VVSGNVPVETGTENALRILAFAGREDVQVFRGAGQPIGRESVHATEVHGSSGLGEAVLEPSSRKAQKNAVGFIGDTLDQKPGEVGLLAVGPLTNLALAEQQSPGILSKAKQIVVMGGAVEEPGNVSPTAEFNFFADPEAARIVIQAKAGVVVVPLDVTQQIGIDREEIARIALQKTKQTNFFEQSTRSVVCYGRENGGYEGVFLHDPAAVAFAIQPDLFSTCMMFADVETTGALTRGQLVVDRRVGVLERDRAGSCVSFAVASDSDGVLMLFKGRVLGIGK
jgi:purine nucleosidase